MLAKPVRRLYFRVDWPRNCSWGVTATTPSISMNSSSTSGVGPSALVSPPKRLPEKTVMWLSVPNCSKLPTVLACKPDASEISTTMAAVPMTTPIMVMITRPRIRFRLAATRVSRSWKRSIGSPLLAAGRVLELEIAECPLLILHGQPEEAQQRLFDPLPQCHILGHAGLLRRALALVLADRRGLHLEGQFVRVNLKLLEVVEIIHADPHGGRARVEGFGLGDQRAGRAAVKLA